MYYKEFSKFYSILGLKFRVKLKPKHYKKVGLIFDSKEGIGNRIFGLMNVINYFTPDTIDIFWDDKVMYRQNFMICLIVISKQK